MKNVLGGGNPPPQCIAGDGCEFVTVGQTIFGTCGADCVCSAGGPYCTLDQ